MYKETNKLIEKIKKYGIENNIPIIMDETLEVIVDIMKDKKISRILEIGTAIGYSALCFAKYLDNNGVIDTIERNQDMINIAEQNFKRAKEDLLKNKNINLLKGDAVEILPNLHNEYDMVFIDAAKGKYPFFLEQSLRMLKPDGIIFADNILYKGYVMSDYNKHKQRTAVTHLRQYIKMATENENLKTQILEVGDGLAITRKS